MDFSEFQNKQEKENKKLKLIFGAIFLLLVAVLIAVLMQRRYFLYKGGSIFKERLLAEEVCSEGFLSLTTGELNPHLVTDEIIEIVEDEPFELEIEEVLKLNSEKLNLCRIVLKSEGKLLSFLITLKENEDFPFFYKVHQVDEVKAKEAI